MKYLIPTTALTLIGRSLIFMSFIGMICLAQVHVNDYLAPGGPHPATVSDYHRGGWHQGASPTNVYPFVMVPGMAFYDTAAGKLYVLDGSTNWVEFTVSGADTLQDVLDRGPGYATNETLYAAGAGVAHGSGRRIMLTFGDGGMVPRIQWLDGAPSVTNTLELTQYRALCSVPVSGSDPVMEEDFVTLRYAEEHFGVPAADPRIVIQESGATSIVYVVHSEGHTNKIGTFLSE